MQIPLQGLGDCNKDDHISRGTSVSYTFLLQISYGPHPTHYIQRPKRTGALHLLRILIHTTIKKKAQLQGCAAHSVCALWGDSTIAEGVQWSKDYAISDPLPLGGRRGGEENFSKTQRSCCFCFCCYQPGCYWQSTPVKSISAPSCLSKSRGKLCFIILHHFCFFGGIGSYLGGIR